MNCRRLISSLTRSKKLIQPGFRWFQKFSSAASPPATLAPGTPAPSPGSVLASFSKFSTEPAEIPSFQNAQELQEYMIDCGRAKHALATFIAAASSSQRTFTPTADNFSLALDLSTDLRDPEAASRVFTLLTSSLPPESMQSVLQPLRCAQIIRLFGNEGLLDEAQSVFVRYWSNRQPAASSTIPESSEQQSPSSMTPAEADRMLIDRIMEACVLNEEYERCQMYVIQASESGIDLPAETFERLALLCIQNFRVESNLPVFKDLALPPLPPPSASNAPAAEPLPSTTSALLPPEVIKTFNTLHLDFAFWLLLTMRDNFHHHRPAVWLKFLREYFRFNSRLNFQQAQSVLEYLENLPVHIPKLERETLKRLLKDNALLFNPSPLSQEAIPSALPASSSSSAEAGVDMSAAAAAAEAQPRTPSESA